MTEALVETFGKYRTTAGVLLNVKDVDDKLLNCRAFQAVRLPTEADTRSQYVECRVGYIPNTREVAYLKTADGKMIASLPAAANDGTASLPEPEPVEIQKHTPEPLGAKPIPPDQFRDFIPEGMRKAHRWGVVNRDKKPFGNVGAPEWDRDFEAARLFRDNPARANMGIHNRVLGYCFGGISNRSREVAGDPDHDNLTAEEAQGKPVGALYMRPEPHYGCIDYDHVTDPNTRELRKDLPEKLAAEITTIAAAWPTEVSASGTGLHIIFEKREGWPAFKKYMDEFPEIPRKKGDEVHREVFSGAGYVNFTGDRWKPQNEPTQEQKDAAYKLLLDIINKHGEKKDTIRTPVSTLSNNKPAEGFKREATSEFCPPKVSTAQFAEWKKRHNAVDICLRNGYTREGDRLRKPNSTHEAGVLIQNGGEKVYSHHAGDPLCDEKPHDAYDCVLILECGGDHTRAGRQILQDLGLSTSSEQRNKKKSTKEVKEEPPKEQPPEYTPEQMVEARKIYELGGMLQYLRDSIHKEHTGDDHIVDAMILSAACIFVQNSEGIHISVSGETGTGKSHVADTVANRMPKKMVLNGGLSDKALYYMVIPNGTVIILDDQSMTPELQKVMKTGTTGWKEPAKYHTVGKENGKNTGITLALPTHAPWWIIKANLTGDEQVMDRMLVLHTDDSPEQHRAILNRILHESNERVDTGIENALWDCLESVTVEIPYTDRIGFEDTMSARNLNLFMDILKAHAVLHAPKRERDGDIIYASKEDFDAAIALFRPLLHGVGGSQALKITKKQQEILNYLCKRDTQNTIPYEVVGEALGIGYRALMQHLNGRDDRGYDGLYTICPVISPDEYTAPDNTNNPHRKKGIKFNREKYDEWVLRMETGVYWIE